jgi:hypothetical protein
MRSEGLIIQGTLSETTVPDLLRTMIRGSETGVLSVGRMDRQDRIYLLEGQIVFATTNDVDYGVAEVLLRTGDINLENYQTVLRKVENARRIGAALCELGYLQPDELLGAFERQVSLIVTQSIGFRGGTYTLEFTTDFGSEVMTLPLRTERLILDAVSRIEHWSLISRGLGDTERLLQHTDHADARLYKLELTEDENHVFGLFSEAQTISAVVSQSYLSNFSTCRLIWALQSVDLIEEAETSRVNQQRAAAVSAFELESNVEKYNSVFQAIFRLIFQKIGDYTWDFVDRVVQHISPDVRPHMSNINLVNEGRVDFDQLMNNLIAAGTPDPRNTIYTVLNELLYGWIYEIKREFGNGLDVEVNEIVRTLRG